MSDEIPKEAIEAGEAIKVSFAAVGAALHCVNAIPGTPFANDIEAAVEAAAPFLRKQFEDEHPVAEEDGHTFTADEWARWATHVAAVASTARGARQVIERAVDAGASPVLAVIERARAEGLAIELLVHPDGGVMCSGITLREANIGWRLIKEVMNASLDECARELLANWPEKGTNDAQ
jgi:hypothetical protein